ncbi:cellulose biosynthesis protein BcsQ [Mesoflavibacter sabulilitoris]|uniref:AAA domain-containing protein n=1 Tax=Mesoflavibacter zeaxanthinifaciens subsp. sabulilitoris TaxID=1520893 RepID=A0A2T1NNK8_9FLAO|nr:ParA family protein [Mesoflavibacter zeaxanthinifaciens]MBB3125242.1 cellulose biosynthesis protein BcsQ [Mesoflavibacter zeaxanthinifaciens subsp. sabulilitoris]PSG94477.1 hypothetical protein C7H61_00660 [Mesoflavibacter zeaxanthinifaciens subsp. sabulilitoris]
MKETKVISFVGEKGGIGKTTINIMAASALHYYFKKSVLLIDSDNPQFSSFKKRKSDLKIFGDFLEDDHKPYKVIKAKANPNESDRYNGILTVQEIVEENDGKYDYIIIDFPGNINEDMTSGLIHVDYAFIPFSHDQLEIESSTSYYKKLMKFFILNEDTNLKKAFLFYNRYQRVKKNKYSKLTELLKQSNFNIGEDAFKYNLLETYVLDKTIYQEEFRNTLFSFNENQENDPEDFKAFINEIIKLTNNG